MERHVQWRRLTAHSSFSEPFAAASLRWPLRLSVMIQYTKTHPCVGTYILKQKFWLVTNLQRPFDEEITIEFRLQPLDSRWIFAASNSRALLQPARVSNVRSAGLNNVASEVELHQSRRFSGEASKSVRCTVLSSGAVNWDCSTCSGSNFFSTRCWRCALHG
ncbi:hypothetical protein F442_15533 [Phytophthora nicotianae P10297]|uniref:Uncharacterized protein n=1 Tax=Phytophthora nicotianae P10297 TaxID=1317064 RepID=W2YQU0_PHYNI|nr:hypothetical protein F442_15533 [Phytophthora nicotianae P10297]